MPPEIAALIASKKAVITPAEAARIMHCAPYLLNTQLKEGNAPFPTFIVGKRVKIPRIPFLRYLGYERGAKDA